MFDSSSSYKTISNEFQEEPPSKKKRVESSTNWTGMVRFYLRHVPENVCVICQPLFSLCVFVLPDEVDEIEVYGSEAQSGTQLATYSFEVKKINEWQKLSFLLCLCMKLTEGCVFIQVCDSILNIGPCAMASMGEPAFLSEEVQTVKRFLMSHLLSQQLYFKVSGFLFPTVPEQP